MEPENVLDPWDPLEACALCPYFDECQEVGCMCVAP